MTKSATATALMRRTFNFLPPVFDVSKIDPALALVASAASPKLSNRNSTYRHGPVSRSVLLVSDGLVSPNAAPHVLATNASYDRIRGAANDANRRALAHGLAVYVLDAQVHLLQLADGADRTVGSGTLARFADAGLVYADGARVRLTPFGRLPLR